MTLLLAIVGTALAAPCIYLGGLTLLSRQRPPRPPGRGRLRFDILVPAHNESSGIAATVSCLLATTYPADRRRIIVVADNCDDDTADVAAAAGATVLARNNAECRGKGYALAHGFAWALEQAVAQAVVVVDADTIVSANLLTAFEAHFADGALALQAAYGVHNASSSWRTRLMRWAFALFHDTRSLARERLRLSCGLRGNGMAFRTEVLQRVAYRAFSVVEDMEYGIELARAGLRVVFVPEAQVLGEMVAGEAASRSQRQRWEGGRVAMSRRYVPMLLREALWNIDPVRLDLAVDLLVPPLAILVLAVGTGLLASTFAWLLGWASAMAVWPYLVATALLTLYGARGWFLSGLGLRGILDLAHVPAYLLWKISLVLRGSARPPDEWVRTERSHEVSP